MKWKGCKENVFKNVHGTESSKENTRHNQVTKPVAASQGCRHVSS